MPEFAHDPALLPDPSAELVLIRVCLEATVATMGRKKGERLLRVIAEKLADEASIASVFHIRPTSQHAGARLAHAQASTIFERYLPVLLARLPMR